MVLRTLHLEQMLRHTIKKYHSPKEIYFMRYEAVISTYYDDFDGGKGHR